MVRSRGKGIRDKAKRKARREEKQNVGGPSVFPFSLLSFAFSLPARSAGSRFRCSRPDDRFVVSGFSRTSERKVRTPQGSAPGNSRSGQPEGQWHRKHTAFVVSGFGRTSESKGEKVR
jgi:hypothetical protein